jgi:hypothetical protein
MGPPTGGVVGGGVSDAGDSHDGASGRLDRSDRFGHRRTRGDDVIDDQHLMWRRLRAQGTGHIAYPLLAGQRLLCPLAPIPTQAAGHRQVRPVAKNEINDIESP